MCIYSDGLDASYQAPGVASIYTYKDVKRNGRTVSWTYSVEKLFDRWYRNGHPAE
jgi:hypothetical protein